MTVEAFLTRELQVRFIDARHLATEAKLSLGVTGYPSKEQQQAIMDEALIIFKARPEQVQRNMRRISASLDAVMMPKGSHAFKADMMDDSSSHTDDFTSSGSVNRERKFKFWPTRRQ